MDLDGALLEPVAGVQGDVFGLAAQVSLAQRRSCIGKVGIRRHDPDRSVGIVLAICLGGADSRWSTADDHQTECVHSVRIPETAFRTRVSPEGFTPPRGLPEAQQQALRCLVGVVVSQPPRLVWDTGHREVGKNRMNGSNRGGSRDE